MRPTVPCPGAPAPGPLGLVSRGREGRAKLALPEASPVEKRHMTRKRPTAKVTLLPSFTPQRGAIALSEGAGPIRASPRA